MWALAALQAAVTLSWMAYGYFQPRLLERFGFESLAGLLTWYLAFAGTTLAPLAGDASDRLVRRGGSRFPVVRAGVALAAASFVAVAVTARAEGGSPARFLLPLFVAIWIAGMTLFQSPALAIVRDTGAPGDLPRVLSPVVVATTLPAALWPWLEPVLARLGGSVTFLAGGLAVTATAFALGSTATVPARPPADAASSGGVARLPLALAFGLASALVVVIATEQVPAAGGGGVVPPVTLATVVGLAAALSAGVMGRLGVTLGSPAALAVSIAVVGAYRVAAPWLAGSAAIALAVLAGGGLALHLATALPLALMVMPAGRAGLAAGLYVGGAMLGTQLVRVLGAP